MDQIKYPGWIVSVLKTQFVLLGIFLFFLLNLPIAAQDKAQIEFAYLQQLQKNNDKDLRDFRVAEYEHFLTAYPFSEKAPEILLALGDEWAQTGKTYRALASYLKLHFLYPEFSPQAGLASRIKKVVEKNRTFSRHSAKIYKLSQVPAQKSRAQRYFQYVEVLISLALEDMKKMMDQVAEEANFFHSHFPDDARRDSLSVWLGDVYRKFGKNKAAASEYLKFDYLYKNSVFLPYARYQRGLLYFQKLKRPQQAIDIFQNVTTEHKDTPFAAKAQFAKARIYEEKFKSWPRAIEAYRVVAKKFGDSTLAIAALEKVAKIQEKRMSAYAEAIDTYHSIIENYTGQFDTPRYYVICAELYLKKLRDYTAAVTHFAEAAEKFPAHKKAPEYLLKAGEISERRVKDYQAAIDYYQQVIKKYPNHKKSRDAKKRIQKLEKKLTPAGEPSPQNGQ